MIADRDRDTVDDLAQEKFERWAAAHHDAQLKASRIAQLEAERKARERFQLHALQQQAMQQQAMQQQAMQQQAMHPATFAPHPLVAGPPPSMHFFNPPY
jgi:hypothetical protein